MPDRQTYRMRAPASGREAFVEADPDGVYVDRETGEELKPVTRVPQAPGFIEGLINLRGVVIPVINLRQRFGIPPREVDEETRTIVLSLHDQTVGCIVDAVTRVMRLTSDQIQSAPTAVLSTARNYISGLAKLDDRLLIVLDVERLFDSGELALEPAS